MILSTVELSIFIMVKKASLIILFFMSACLCMTSEIAYATGGFSLTPIQFEDRVEPGEKIKHTLTVENRGKTAKVKVTVQDFRSDDESGTPIMMSEEEKDSERQYLSSWINTPDILSIDTFKTKDVPFSISIPKDAEPGSYYAAIFIENLGSNVGESNISSVGTVTKIGALVFVTVEGEIHREMKVLKFHILDNGITDDEIRFVTQIHNLGNVFERPMGKVIVKDSNGRIIQNISSISVRNEKHDEIRNIQTDYLPFNRDKGFIILPKQTRSIETIWKKGDLMGEYSAYMILEGGGELGEIQSEEIFIEVREELTANIETDGFIHVSSPINLKIHVKNTGTAQMMDPKLTLEIYNIFGARVDRIKLNMEDPENEGQTIHLGSGQTFEQTVAYESDDLFGYYTVKLIEESNDEEVITSSSILVGNLTWIIALLAGGIGIFAIIAYLIWNYIQIKRRLNEVQK